MLEEMIIENTILKQIIIDTIIGYIPFFWGSVQYYFTLICILFILIFPIFWYIRKLKNTTGNRVMLFFKFIGISLLTIIGVPIIHGIFMNLSSVVKQIPEGQIFIAYNKEQQEQFGEVLAHKFISSLEDTQKTESKLKDLDERINIIPEDEVVKIFIYDIINGRFFARNAKIINTINNIRKEYEKGNISTNMLTDKDFFLSPRNKKIKNQLLKIFNTIPKVNQIFSEEEKNLIIKIAEFYILGMIEEYDKNKTHIQPSLEMLMDLIKQ